MKRSIKSNQREVVQLHFVVNAAGTAVTGIDQNQVSCTDTGTGVKTIELDEPLQDMVIQVSHTTAGIVSTVAITDTDTIVVSSFALADGTTATDAICHISVVGSLITDRN